MTPSAGRPMYLDVDGSSTFAVLHATAPGRARDTAIVFCPPFGWEEVCSYRAIREWAGRLAAAGFSTLRLTYPGAGDSAGQPRDPDRLKAWTNGVAVAADALRAQTGSHAVVAIGLGLGGLLAYRAVAGGAAIDGLVLWATPAKGSDLTRQLHAFARLEASQMFEGLQAPPPLAEGELEAGGFVLSAQTHSDLRAVDLGSAELAAPLALGALLLERDGMAVDERLRDALSNQGVAVTVAPGNGFAAMTSHPQRNELPEDVLGAVADWLRGVSEPAPAPEPSAAEAAAVAEIRQDDSVILETPVQIPVGSLDLSGVLTTPATGGGPVCVVMLNAGAIRRIGPNRMWVEAGRRWAALGIPSLRLDVEGIGEADGPAAPYAVDDNIYVPKLAAQVTAAVDWLAESRVADHYVLAGMCSGAYWALHAGLDHPLVHAAWMLNSRAIVWDTGLAPARDVRRLFSQPLTWTRIRDNVTPARVIAVLRWLLSLLRQWPRRRGESAPDGTLDARIDNVLDRLRRSRKQALFLFSAAEPLEEELVSSGRMRLLDEWPNVVIEHVPVRDHTIKPVYAQSLAHAALDRALKRALAPIPVRTA